LIMKSIIKYLIFFSVLIILAIIFFFKGRTPFGKSNSSFAIQTGKEITEIEFFNGERRLNLMKQGEEWLVNRNKETRKSSILFIEKILREMKIKSPVSVELFDTEIIQKGIEPVKVKVYGNRKLLQSFLVYKTGSNTYGNIMKIRERSKPFIVHVPGYETDIGSVFTLNEKFWQPYIVFNLLPSEIGTVTLENLRDTTSSFSIRNTGNNFILSDLSGYLYGWDTVRVVRYLSYFVRIPFEKWAFEIPSMKEEIVESDEPIYRINVTDTDGNKTLLTIRELVIKENGELRIDTDRVGGQTEKSEEMFIMRYFDIDPILKKKSYFFPE
jgi:hypothetical protein